MTFKKTQNRKINNSASKSHKKLLAVCLMFAMTLSMLVGCGNGDATSPADGTGAAAADGTANKADAQGGGNGADGEDAGSEPAAMGRYVETTVDISENTSRSLNITTLADGRLLILDDGAGQLISSDGG